MRTLLFQIFGFQIRCLFMIAYRAVLNVGA
jgi:hypothetical protein